MCFEDFILKPQRVIIDYRSKEINVKDSEIRNVTLFFTSNSKVPGEQDKHQPANRKNFKLNQFQGVNVSFNFIECVS